MPATADEDPVEAFGSRGAHEALREGVGRRCRAHPVRKMPSASSGDPPVPPPVEQAFELVWMYSKTVTFITGRVNSRTVVQSVPGFLEKREIDPLRTGDSCQTGVRNPAPSGWTYPSSWSAESLGECPSERNHHVPRVVGQRDAPEAISIPERPARLRLCRDLFT